MTQKKLPKSVRPEEFKKLIQAVPRIDSLTRISFLLAYGSGLRISEVLRLKPEQVTNNIFVEESKYGVERIVPVPKGWKPEFKKKLPIDLILRTLQRRFKAYAKKAKLSPLYTFHSLRHGFATRCLESGVPLNQVQLFLGHSNLSTTSLYLKASPTDALKNYEELF